MTKHNLVFTHGYTRRAATFIRNRPAMLKPYQKTLELLELNPFHPSLRLHKPKGSIEEIRSVSINLAHRITIEFLIEGKTIIPVNAGPRDEVY